MNQLSSISAALRGETEVFGIRKTWVDPAPGIEMVQVHYAWSPTGQQPDWDTGDSRVLTRNETSPGLRTAVIEVPREVDGSREYSLHHFFFVVHGTESITSPVFSEEIVTREVVYQDDLGDWTQVGISWGISPERPGLVAPNYTAAAMDGLVFEDAGAGAPPEPVPIYEFVQAQPLPHVFRGIVWGPRGVDVQYVFHLVRAGSLRPEEDTEVWDDNIGRGWSVRV